MRRDPVLEAVIQTVISLAGNLRLDAVAEGVETTKRPPRCSGWGAASAKASSSPTPSTPPPPPPRCSPLGDAAA